MKPRATGCRGSAILSVLLILSAILPVGALVVFEARLQSLLARNVRQQAAAFYTAEAGLALATAAVTDSSDPASLLDGVDGTPGTADDGLLIIPAGPPLAVDQGAYDLRIERASPSLLRLVSTGRGSRGGRAVVSALLKLGAATSPAALVLDGPLTLAESDLVADGRDLGPSPPVPALVRSAAVAIEDADYDGAAARIDTVEAEALAQRLRSHPRARLYGTALPSSLGTAAAPELSWIAADAVVAAGTDGNGVVVIAGDLLLKAELRFAGAVVVLGGIATQDAGRLLVDGTVWIAPRAAELVAIGGGSVVRYDSGALARAEAALPGAWPRPIEVAGWQEIL
ncbi:MAG TPA: hypothetical protein VEB21_04395 [Terriglobales bacterium]|nr:hypothetical protein [Terriglobales bacterium]